VLYIDRVGSADDMGEVEKVVDLESRWWGFGEHVSDPVVEAVAVAEEAGEDSYYRVRFWTWGFAWRVRSGAEEANEDEDWNGSEKQDKKGEFQHHLAHP
jgi:hypothetical protein